MLGQSVDPVVLPERSDRRFKDEAWVENAIFDFIRQSYLLTARSIHKTVSEIEGLDAKTAGKVDFYTRQFVDAMAPSNFVMTNPQVLKATLESGGENLVKGLSNLLDDLDRGKGQLRVKMTDLDAFELGKNVATTPGKVVFQNDLMQLIQYSPSTEQVFRRPLLIVPPWINKFYILDLQPKNSFIKWAVDQGLTVFIISWVNPDEKLAEADFEDYMLGGPIAALDAIEQATGVSDVNAIGYCIGGTLMGSTLAWMAASGDARIKSITFFTALLDFSEVGELSVFIDEEQISMLERKMEEKGYLEGSHMATTFNMLRANDLIWSFVVKNYLLGEDPFPFDLLYWNSDSTRMPKRMHSFYLRNMYQENRLSEPGGIKLNGTSINLTRIRIPAYFLSTAEDHIAPWQSTYSGTKLLQGANRFVLAGSGHIAGVINPPNPDKPKYGYWTNDDLAGDADNWYAAADHHEGSWWPDWQRWVSSLDATIVAARDPSAGGLTVIEDAPGSYVKKRYS
jgi:polyhydroxyalkanoate synthase